MEFKDSEGRKQTVFGITPDLYDAVGDGLGGFREVTAPRHAQSFDELTETVAQTSRLIQHLELFRDLSVVAADKSHPHADRKALGIAAAMSGSRLYRVLAKHGRPTDRTKGHERGE